jgi:imidazole glycerol-phosphate synthase subunit HisH
VPDSIPITLVDYGVGNIASLANMLDHVGVATQLSSNPRLIEQAPKLILPGVGSFAHAMSVLRERGLDEALRAAAGNGAMLLGVCLGMQLLSRFSEEGNVTGLNLIEADVRKIETSDENLKIPNMGWREVHPAKDQWLVRDLSPPERFYFAHSFYMVCDRPEDVAATIDYGGIRTVAIARGNIFGAQFHPEKSHRFGMRLLKNFAELRA